MKNNITPGSWPSSKAGCLIASLTFGLITTSTQAQTKVWKPMHLTTPAQLAAGELGGEGCQRPQMIEMDSEDGKLIFFGTDVGGLFRSTDGGLTFAASNQGLETTGVVDVKVDPKNKNRVILIGDGGGNQYNIYGGVYLSTDQGTTWTRERSRWLDAVGSGGRQNGRDQVAFDLSSYDSGLDRCQTIYWVSEDDKQDSKGALWKSTNGGDSWSIVCQDTQYDGADDAYSLIEVHPTLGYVYIANKNGFYRSTNGGTSFTQIMSGNFKSLDVVASAPNTVWAAAGSTLYKSTDSGATLNVVPSTGLSNIYHLKVSPVNNNHMVAGDSGNSNKPYYSTDGGATWSASGIDMSGGWIPSSIQPMNRVCSRVWHPTDANIIWSLGKGDQMMKSTNKGQNFAYAGRGVNNVMIGHGFSFNYHNPSLVYLGFQDYNGGMTTDGGKSWTHVNLPTGDNWGWVRSAYAVTDQKYFGIDENYSSGTFDLWFTTNAGANKSKKVSNIGGLRICYGDPSDVSVLFAGNRRSSDGGSSWQVMSDCNGVFTHNFVNNDLYGAKGRDVVRSTDKGATWTTVTTMDANVTDIAYDHVNDRLWVTAGDDLFRCNGPAYTPDERGVSGCPASTVAIDPNNTNTIYVGGTNGTWRRQDNHVMRSTDGGASFHKLVQQNGAYGPDGGSNAEWIRVHPETGDAWVATNCHGMWRFGAPEDFVPTADAYVRGGSYANDNYGGTLGLVAKESSNSNFDRKSYLKFDVSALNDAVQSATLKITVSGTINGSSSLRLYEVDNDSWTENGITWNNKPGAGGLISSQSVNSSTTSLTFDVSAFVQEQINGDGIVSFRLDDGGNVGYMAFHSRENITPPALNVITAPGGGGGGGGNPILEIGEVNVSQADSSEWHTITMASTFTDPVVVMGPVSSNGGDPCVVRVKDVTSNSFKFQIDEWDYLDGAHNPTGGETIAYMVVEAGQHDIGGQLWEAGNISAVDDAWKTKTFDRTDYGGAQTVLTQCTTVNGAAAVTTRIQNITSTSFQVRLQEEQAADGSHVDETVAYVAISKGTGTESGMDFEAGQTGNEVTEAYSTINFTNSLATPVFFGQIVTYDGADPAALRYQNLGSNSVQVKCEEEQSGDTEVTHTSEEVRWAAFEVN